MRRQKKRSSSHCVVHTGLILGLGFQFAVIAAWSLAKTSFPSDWTGIILTMSVWVSFAALLACVGFVWFLRTQDKVMIMQDEEVYCEALPDSNSQFAVGDEETLDRQLEVQTVIKVKDDEKRAVDAVGAAVRSED